MRDGAHAVAAAQIGHANLTEQEGLHVTGDHRVQKLMEGGAGLETERASEAGAQGRLGAGTNGNVEDSKDRGSLGERLHDDAPTVGFGGSQLGRAIGSSAGGLGTAVNFGGGQLGRAIGFGAAVAFAGDERRLFNAAHGTEFGALLTHLAGGVVGAGAAAAGAEGAVAAGGVLGLVGGDAGRVPKIEAKPDLSDWLVLFAVDKDTPVPMIFNEPVVLGHPVGETGAGPWRHR